MSLEGDINSLKRRLLALEHKVDTFFLGQKVPRYLLTELMDYIGDHKTPSSIFLQNVLCNDLYRAVLTEEADGIGNLGAIVNFLHNNSPMLSWGSEENYRKWLRGEESKK